MADTCHIRIPGSHGAAIGVIAVIGALVIWSLCLTACARTSRYGAGDERRLATEDLRTEAAAGQRRLPTANLSVPAAIVAPPAPVASAVPVVPRPSRGVAPRHLRLMRWVHGQIHGRRCRIPDDTFARPLGLYLADRHPRRRVVLTFDDGPLYRRTDRILDLLRRYRLKATFFVVGSMIHGSTFRTVQRIVREGHILANHSYHHRTRMAKHRRARATIRAELQLTQAMVDIALLAKTRRQFRKLRLRLLGGEKRSRFPGALLRMWPVIAANWRAILRDHGRRDGQSPHAMRYARPPGGNPLMGRWTRAQRRSYAAAVQGLGLITVLWNSASADSTPGLPALQRKDAVSVSGSILRGAYRGGVLLMHDWMSSAHLAPALETISASRVVRVVSLHRLVRRKFGCDPVWLSHLVRAREAHHVLGEQRARRAKRRGPSRMPPSDKLHPVAPPAPAPAPPSAVATTGRVL